MSLRLGLGGGEHRVDGPVTRPGELLPLAYRWLFLAYLFAVTAFSRNFARLHTTIAGVPLFVGEATMVALATVVVGCLLQRRRGVFRLDRPVWALLGYLAIGAVFAALGLARGHGLAALRDFALVYYLVLFFFTLAFFGLGGTLAALVRAIVLGGVTAAALATTGFLVQPTLTWEHAAPGYVALTAWLAMCWSWISLVGADRSRTRALHAAVIALCSVAVYLSAYRTMLAVVIAGAVALAVAGRWCSWRRGVTAGAYAAAWLGVLGVAVYVHAYAPRRATTELPTHGATTISAGTRIVSARWVRGVTLPRAVHEALVDTMATVVEEDTPPRPTLPGGPKQRPSVAPTVPKLEVVEFPNRLLDSVGFRRLVWGNALARILRSPLTGIGLGTPAALFPDRFCEIGASPLSNCGTAHNSYLTIAMRLGVPMLLLFLAINAAIVVRLAARDRRSWGTADGADLRAFLVAALAAFAVYALTGLFLESPYLSSLYWVVLGALAHVGGGRLPHAAAAEVDAR